MESSGRFLRLAQYGFAVLLFFLLTALAAAQSPYGSPYAIRGGLDLAPSNPFGMPGSTGGLPGGSNSLSLNSGMFRGLLPVIPNLQAGYVFNFGRNVGQGRGIIDYIHPVGTGDTVLFGEVHGEFQNFWKWSKTEVITPAKVGVAGLEQVALTPNRRIDLAFGGGYRTFVGGGTLLGGNAFFDTTQLADTQWYSSGGIGLEMASLLPGSGLIDLQFNYYGNLFSGSALRNAFRHGAGSLDFEVGYSQPVLDESFDLRVKAAGYRFDVYTGQAYGFRLGGELTTRDGRFSARYEYTNDHLNNPYHSVGLYVNVGFQLENLFTGESPITAPEPIFASPRNLRRLLGKPVRRNWHQPSQVVVARSLQALPRGGGGCGGPTVTVTQSFTCPQLPIPPGCTYDCATNTCTNDPTGGTTVTAMGVAGATTNICKVVVVLNIYHTQDSDLEISLTSPAGTTVVLFSLHLYSIGPNFLGTILDQTAAVSIDDGAAPFTGTWRPSPPGDLNNFNGEDANGNWTLTIIDHFDEDCGFLQDWTLIIQ
jgi:subtilisin-like proprotein convertase family protein